MTVEPIKSSRWPHIFGVLGFVLSIASLLWQVHVYRDSFAEKALLRLSSHQKLNTSFISGSAKGDRAEVDTDSFHPAASGELRAEVVNVGQHPLYVKRISITVPCPWVNERSEERSFVPDNPSAIPLQPGAAVGYHIYNWDFSTHPLESVDEPSKNEKYCVVVESNKGDITRLSSGLLHSYTFENIIRRK